MRSVPYEDLMAKDWPRDIIIGVPGHPEDSILSRGDRLVLAGEQKAGKSILLAQMIRGLVMGTDFVGFPIPSPRRVLYIQAELREGRLKKRYAPWEAWARTQGISMPPGMFHVWSTNGPLYLTGYETHDGHKTVKGLHGLEMIYEELQELKPDVVMFDPLSSFHDINESSSQELKQLLDELDRLKERVNMSNGGFAMVIAHHFRKTSGMDKAQGISLVNQVRGSSALAGWADSLIAVGIHEENSDHKFMEFTLRDTDSRPERELRYNYTTKSFDWFDPRQALGTWALEFLAANGGRARGLDFYMALKAAFPNSFTGTGKVWMKKAEALLLGIARAGFVKSEVNAANELWISRA